MLLNLSNHLLENWSPLQIKTATDKYGIIENFPFPLIPPTMTSIELDELVLEVEGAIIQKKPQLVHIMGEMTFVFRMVTALKKRNISCIASTTTRDVIEEGNTKTSVFKFIQFREY